MGKNGAVLLLSLCLLPFPLLSTGGGIRQQRRPKLFVFGDSYADTGNLPRQGSPSWKWPYGATVPGKPSGRFSDGRVLTDYIAKFLRIKSPLPYNLIKNFSTASTRYGINFAHGGTGVFNTMVAYPNMSMQVDFFQQVVNKKIYTVQNLNNSIALVSLAGNDYSTYLAKNGKDLTGFSKLVIAQLVRNLKRIHELGMTKIAVTGLQPLGCLPVATKTTDPSYVNCSAILNDFSSSHNTMLKQEFTKAFGANANADILYLDLIAAFAASLKLDRAPSGIKLRDILKPCCVGPNGEDCGLVDKSGIDKFEICNDPSTTFFWDSIHPSNAGWQAVYFSLKHSLHSLLY